MRCLSVYGAGIWLGRHDLLNHAYRSLVATNVATVAGIAAVGSGVAAVVLPPIVVAVVNAISLSAAFALEAALALLLGLLVFALLRNFPEDMGLKPYVSKKAKKARASRSALA